jgi:hypothetical protein
MKFDLRLASKELNKCAATDVSIEDLLALRMREAEQHTAERVVALA